MKLKIFRSHEEMENDRLRVAAEMDPMEGIAQTTELILRVYGLTREALFQRHWPDKITITIPE